MKAAAALVACGLALASRSALASEPCVADMSQDGAGSCARVITPAFVASSSIQPYGRFRLEGAWRSATITPFASEFGSGLSEFGLTASPQIGFRVAPFLLVYLGADGVVTSGVNVGTLVAQGAVASGDWQIGTVAQVHGSNWRIALNGRLLHGSGEAIDLDRAVLGVNANFLNSGLVQAIGQVNGALADIVAPYSITSGRLDLTGAYDDGGWFSFQGAIGGESIRQEFTPLAPNDLQSVLTTAAPRLGVAIGIDPSKAMPSNKWFPVQFLVEYQVTVQRSWTTVYGAESSSQPARVAESVIALGFYSPPQWNVTPQENIQIGITPYYQFGLPTNLLTASQENITTSRPTALGVVTSLHYLF